MSGTSIIAKIFVPLRYSQYDPFHGNLSYDRKFLCGKPNPCLLSFFCILKYSLFEPFHGNLSRNRKFIYGKPVINN